MVKNNRITFVMGILCGGVLVQTYYFYNVFDLNGLPDVVPVNISLSSGNSPIGNSGSISFLFEKVSTIYTVLQDQYFDQHNLLLDKMVNNAVRGFVSAIDDPFTVYFDKEENSSFEKDIQGEQDFEGVGLVVAKKDDGILIQEVIKGAPGFLAGIRPLDVIIEINGEKTNAMSLNDAVTKMRGKKGTDVELTLFRSSDQKVWKQKVVRDKILIPSVKSDIKDLVGGKKALYIELSIIGEQTEKILKDILAEHSQQKIDGVIIDLRGNGGGILDVAVAILSHFVPRDIVLVSSQYTAYPDEQYASKGFGPFEHTPVVVLIDQMSASASEIIAGALKQLRGAILVGSKTFGKGSIQTLHGLSDGSSIKFTIGKRFLPDMTNVDKVGIKPDVEIEFSREEFEKKGVDNQLEEAKKQLSTIIK